jgi:hypothetical protein
MPRLPQPGGDAGNWGDILNGFLLAAHGADGSLKDGAVSEQKLSGGLQTKLNAASSRLTAVPCSSNYTARPRDFVVGDASGAGFTVTLPAPTNGAVVTVKKTDSTPNAIIVMRSGVPVDGDISVSVNNQWQSQDFFADGTQWYRV